MAMEKSYRSGGMGLKDNEQASPVKSVNTMAEDYDKGRIKYYSSGTRGYPQQAIQGDWNE